MKKNLFNCHGESEHRTWVGGRCGCPSEDSLSVGGGGGGHGDGKNVTGETEVIKVDPTGPQGSAEEERN